MKKFAAIITCLLLLASIASAQTDHADKIVIEKALRNLTLLRQGKVIATYHVSLGSEAEGEKVRQGDGRTPEGAYVIDGRNENSKFYKSLHISYPNAEDRARAQRLGVSPGGDVMIHGIRNGLGWLGPFHCIFAKIQATRSHNSRPGVRIIPGHPFAKRSAT